MGFQVSPGVNVTEIDLSTIVPAVSTTDVAHAGVFKWGPLQETVLLGNELQLVEKFGKPDNDTASSFFTAANILSYGDKLRLVRVADEDVALNATVDGSGILIKNDDHYEIVMDSNPDVGTFAARHAGALGNSLEVSVCDSANAFSMTLTGTVSSSGTTVTGDTTSFDTEVEVGDYIIVAGQIRQVADVTSATEIETTKAFDPAISAGATATKRWKFADAIGIAPGTSEYAASRGGSNDELHIIVTDSKGEFSGIPGTVLERHSFLSKASDAKSETGDSIYYVEKIKKESKYIRFLDHKDPGSNYGTAALNTAFDTSDKSATDELSGGLDGNTGSAVDSAKIEGFNLFADAESVDVAIIALGEASQAVILHVINSICEVRKDCIAVISPERDDVVNNSGNEKDDIIAFRDSLPSSSYAVMDSGWKYQYDRYNDVFRWVPLNGDIAGLMVRTDIENDAWFSPAGYNRGLVKNVIKLAWNPFKAERDDLYLKGVNPVITQAGQGTLLFGDKTLLAKPSAFDRINVRRLFIVLEKAIATAAKFTLFEFNDEFTRAQFRNLVEPFLRDVQGRRGIIDFRVVADSTNNTAEVIDRNEFIGDIYIKPARSINFIQLNFVAVRSGVEFSEIVGKF
jgi:hypothetical protein